MFNIYKVTLNPVVDYAAEELKKYLRMMMPSSGEVTIHYGDGSDGFRLGLLKEFGLSDSEAEDPTLDDIVHIDTDVNGGILAGSNPRSILFAVYFFLRENGCRWLFPGVDGEFIPIRDIAPVSYHKMADVRYRGQCNEGAESQQCMLDTIEFSPKIGLNSYMMEFDIPMVYYKKYYEHSYNPSRKKEPVTKETVLQWKRVCETEIAKRGLMFHDMGHGWTAESFGISSIGGWTRDLTNKIPEEAKDFVAMVNGKRELYNGVALNTNFCMSNAAARQKVCEAVVQYAKKSPHVDYLHVWLADWQRNHCECENCRKMIPSDWYAVLLNDVDEALTKEGLNTRIGGCAYSDTAWEPLQTKLKNPKRFLMNMGAITRSYKYSVEKDPVPEQYTSYVLNVSERMDTMEEYVAHVHKWMEMAECSFFAYEYHFWKAQALDPSGLHIAKRIYEDIRSYLENRFKGIIEDGSQRAFFPNGFAYYVYGLSMFDLSISFETLTEDYFTNTYGPAKDIVMKYLKGIDETLSQEYLEYIHSKPVKADHYRNPAEIEKLRKVDEICKEAEEALKDLTYEHRVQTMATNLLFYHMEYCRGLANAFILKCEGKDAEAKQYFSDFFREFGKKEVAIERYYDQHNNVQAFTPIFSSLPEAQM